MGNIEQLANNHSESIQYWHHCAGYVSRGVHQCAADVSRGVHQCAADFSRGVHQCAGDAPKVVPRRSSDALHPSFTLAVQCNHIFYLEFSVNSYFWER